MSKAQWIKENLKPGEQYAGILLGKNDEPDQHVILLPGQSSDVTWKAAKAWTKKAGGELPTRREQSLLFANLKEEFEARWYWSGEQSAPASGYAWYQDFNYGYQSGSHIDVTLRARAVRRLPV